MKQSARAIHLAQPAPAEARPLGEDAYRKLVEHVPAITYIAAFSADAPFTYVSPQIEPLLGFPVERWLSDPELWGDRLHPDDRERVLEAERLTFERCEPYEGEFRMLAADGRVVWLWERDTIVFDDAGTPVCTEGVLVDVTELKATQRALEQSEGLLRAERDRAQGYLDIASTMIVVLDAGGTIEMANRRACAVLGRAEDELLGQNWFELVVPEREQESARSDFDQLVAGRSEAALDVERPVLTREGDERLIAWHNAVLKDHGGRITGALRSGEDITERRAAEQRVAFLAYHDQHTGLPNRSNLSAMVDRAVEKARREEHSVGLVCLDVDDFKLVNDSLGHKVGNELLVSVARRLEAVTRHGDILARTGGDEFFLLLPDLPPGGLAEGVAAARRMTTALAEPFEVAGAELHVSASLGVSLYPRLAAGGEELMRQADTAMYQAKRSGRSGHAVYTPEEQHPLDRLSLTARLRRSIDNGELELHYQPIYSWPPASPCRSRPCCAGTTPPAASCRRRRSSPRPSTAGSSSRSANGWWVSSAARRRTG